MSKKENKNLFQKLTKLFRSGPIVKRKIRTLDTAVAVPDKTKSSGALLFQKSSAPTYATITANAYNLSERLMRYQDFGEMEYTPELASALDIYSDETCAQDEKGRVLHIYSDNEKIKEILENLFYNTLNVEFNLRSWVRNIVKYGDFFLYNDVSPTHGVINAFPIPVNEIEREENYDPNDPMAVRFRWVTLGNRTLENWEISHFRLLGNDMFLPYGSSVIEPARRIWRQLILIEDAMLVYRVVRAPERRVFYIDVANIPAENVPMFVEEQRKNLRSSQVIDKSTGRVDLRYNPLCLSLQSLIKLQDDRTLDLSTLIKEWESGKQDQWVYSIDHETKNVVPGKVVWAGITRKNAELVRVWLDDGTYHDTTPDHRFMLRDGTYKKAEDLTQGESLMPLYTKLSSKEEGDSIVGYEKIYDPATGKFLLTHRNNVIVNEGFDAIIGKVIHHADFNKKNNTPSNLVPMSWKDHQKLHGDLCVERNRSPAGRECSKNRMKKTWKEGKINKQTFVDLWNDEKIRQLRINKLTKSIDDNRLVEFCFSAMDRLRTGLSTKESALLDSLNADEKFVSYMNENNADFKNGFSDKISRSYLQTHLKLFGFKKSIEDMKRAWLLSRIGTKNLVNFCKLNVTVTRKDILAHFNINRTSYNWLASQVSGSVNEFAKAYMPASARYMRKSVAGTAYMNHKVSRVERLTRTEDTGCITVEKYHNFAVQGLHGVDTASDKLVNSFIYLHNSVDEDYFIPVRGGESGTRIETLAGGQNTAAVEDVAYIQKKLFAALKIPRAYLGYDEALCLLGYNRIPLLDGRILSVEELAKEYTENPNKQNFVYSSDVDGSIKPGRVINAWKTKEVDYFYRVNLDSGGHIDCTGNHPFLCRDGSYKRADELQAEQSLMPLYRKLSNSKKFGGQDLLDGYEMVLDNSNGNYDYTHKLVNECVTSGVHEIKKQRVLHHIDFDKRNNNPNNLAEMTWFDHRKLHSQCLEHTLLRPDVIVKREPLRIAALKATKHRLIKSKQLAKQHADPDSKMSVWVNSKEFSEAMSDVMKKNWENKEYRALKSSQSSELWNTEEYRSKYMGDNHWVRVKNVKFTIESLIEFCNTNNVNSINQWRKDHPASVSSKCVVGMRFVMSLLKRSGFNNWRDFAFQKLLIEVPKCSPDPKNHKVISVEIIKLQKPVAVYDIEVEKWHNFAVGSDRITQLQKGVSGGDDYVFVHNSSKATLAQEDIRFSRTISVIQKTVIAELNKLAIIHLYANGFDSEDLQNFTLHMSNPSTVAQQQKLELWRAKFEIAGTAPEGQMSKEFIRKEIWGLNEQQCKDIDEQRLKEKLVDAAIEGAKAPDEGDDAAAGSDDAETDDSPADDAEGDDAGGAEDLFAGDDIGNKNPELKLLTMSDDPVDDEDLPIDFSSLDVDIPVKAQTQLHKAMYNRGRINHHGPAKTHMPDFEKMLSPRKSDADIYDQKWASSYLRNPFGESVTRQQHKTPIGNDVMSSLRKMSLSPKFVASSTQTDINTGLLKEEIEDQADEKEYNEVLIIDDDI
jgi:intein/homing endonuclease